MFCHSIAVGKCWKVLPAILIAIIFHFLQKHIWQPTHECFSCEFQACSAFNVVVSIILIILTVFITLSIDCKNTECKWMYERSYIWTTKRDLTQVVKWNCSKFKALSVEERHNEVQKHGLDLFSLSPQRWLSSNLNQKPWGLNGCLRSHNALWHNLRNATLVKNSDAVSGTNLTVQAAVGSSTKQSSLSYTSSNIYLCVVTSGASNTL